MFLRGLNCRTTEDFVTDGVREQFLSNALYPQAVGGMTLGYEAVQANTSNRDAGVDPRLAGIHFKLNTAGNPAVFRLDLARVGSYVIRLAVGDAGTAQAEHYVRIRDTDSDVLVIAEPTGTNADEFIDATGVKRALVDWPSQNLPVTVDFVTQILRAIIGHLTGGGSVGNTTVAHLWVEEQLPDLESFGFNFRKDIGFVEDHHRGIFFTGSDNSSAPFVPLTYHGHPGFGIEISGARSTANMTAGYPGDPRIGGSIGQFNAGAIPIRVKLPSAGLWAVRIAYGGYWTTGDYRQMVEIWDGPKSTGTLLLSLDATQVISQNIPNTHVLDAGNNYITKAEWVAQDGGEIAYLTFATDEAYVYLGGTWGGGSSQLNHVGFSKLKSVDDITGASVADVQVIPTDVAEKTVVVTVQDAVEIIPAVLADSPIGVAVTEEGVTAVVEETTITAVIDERPEAIVVDRTTLVDDVGGGVTYIGKAAPGSATSAAVWQLSRLTEGQIFDTGDDVKVEWADKGDGPNANFDKVWDDRLTYAYG